jgi:hypothetical protein
MLFIATGNGFVESAVARRYHTLGRPAAELRIVPGINHCGDHRPAPRGR